MTDATVTDYPVVDPWEVLGLPGGLTLASYLTAPGTAAQYRLIVDVLLDQQAHSLTGVGHEELADLLRQRLAATGDQDPDALLESMHLKARMAQLDAWGVVDTWDERPTRDEDFLRNANRYQLTTPAARFHLAVRRLGEEATESVVALFAPPVLRAELARMADALGTEPAVASQAWAVVQSTLDTMAQAAAGWQARLAGALAGAPDPDKVTAVQETLTRYVDMWGAGVDTHSEAIAATAQDLLTRSAAQWRPVALTVDPDAPEDRVGAVQEEFTATLRQVLAWFAGSGSQARRLRRQMRDAIAPMVRGQRTLAAVGGHVSRRAELLALAGALEASDDDTAAWGLWCTATGLFSARHLRPASPQPGGQPGSVSFWDAEPAPVEARLRRHGARALTGRPARIADRSDGRAAARALAARQRQAAATTRARLLARSGLRLSQWTDVTAEDLDVLVRLLAAVAAASPPRGWPTHARTGDGQWHLRVDPPTDGAPDAVLTTPAGRLVHPDLRLHLTSPTTAADLPVGTPA